MGRERRRRTRRSTGTRSTAAPAPMSTASTTTPPAAMAAPASDVKLAASVAPVQVRSDRVLAHEAMTMISEMKRVAVVSSVCFGMLAVLVVVERLQ